MVCLVPLKKLIFCCCYILVIISAFCLFLNKIFRFGPNFACTDGVCNAQSYLLSQGIEWFTADELVTIDETNKQQQQLYCTVLYCTVLYYTVQNTPKSLLALSFSQCTPLDRGLKSNPHHHIPLYCTVLYCLFVCLFLLTLNFSVIDKKDCNNPTIQLFSQPKVNTRMVILGK